MSFNPERVVVVTGGNSGIGRAVAIAFAKDNSQVVIVGRNEETLRKTCWDLGSAATWYQADVSRSDQVTTVVTAIVQRFGHITVLVNCAGYGRVARGVW